MNGSRKAAAPCYGGVEQYGLESILAGVLRESMMEIVRSPLLRQIIKEAVREELKNFSMELAAAGTSGRTVTVAQAAKFAGVTDGTIREWIGKGRLTALKAGNRYRIKMEELERTMADVKHPEHVSLEAEAAMIVALNHKQARKKGA